MNPTRFNSSTIEYRAARGVGTDKPQMTVEAVDNHVYFYADVSSEHCLSLVRAMRETDARLRAEHVTRGLDSAPPVPIWLHMYSYGGDLFTGFSVADQLSMVRSPIYSVVEGICASAATLISMSCTRRYILPRSFMLIHQLSAFVWGTHEQFKDEMTLQQKAMDRLVEFYVEKSRVGSEADLRTMLQRDFWMDAETCLQQGFVDEILKPS